MGTASAFASSAMAVLGGAGADAEEEGVGAVALGRGRLGDDARGGGWTVGDGVRRAAVPEEEEDEGWSASVRSSSENPAPRRSWSRSMRRISRSSFVRVSVSLA